MNTGSIKLEIKDQPCFITFIGNTEILKDRKTAIFCSVKCPGALILKTYDFAQKLRAENRTVISGFHSPIEKECLRIFLRSPQHVIICPARSLEKMRIPSEWKRPLDENRMLILSAFDGKVHRPTTQLAQERNDFVATLADEILISYATPGSKTEAFVAHWKESGKKILTL